MSVEEDCPIRNSSQHAKERFALANVAEHVEERARHDDTHQDRIDEHTENGTLSEIRTALRRPETPTE